MTTLILAAAFLSAPPPMPDPGGGWITLWLDEKPVRFRGNGKDVTPVEQLIDASLYPYGPRLTPDLSSIFVLDSSAVRNGRPDEKRAPRLQWGKLVICPLKGKEGLFVLPGYVLTALIPSSERDKLYFWGVEGEEFDPEKPKPSKLWIFDFATRKLAPFTLKLPENHRLSAIGKEGKTLLTSITLEDQVTYSHRTYLVSPEGKASEILKENTFLTMAQFSQDGSKLFGMAETFKGGKPGPNGLVSHRMVVVDTKTRVETIIAYPARSGRYAHWTWAADSSGVAVIWSDPAIVRGPLEFKLYLLAADGSGSREIYKGAGRTCAMLDWR